MKNVFTKQHLPLIDKVIHKACSPRDNWELAATMIRKDRLSSHISSEIMLLERGAHGGDVWSMCQLARALYYSGSDILLPEALSWWAKAARLGDGGATSDLQNTDILSRILAFSDPAGEYESIEMKCAMLAEYYLTDMGRTQWSSLTRNMRLERTQRLIDKTLPVLGITAFRIRAIFDCEMTYDGLAESGKLSISFRDAITVDYERMIQVIFHELGHFVHFIIQGYCSGDAAALKRAYGIDDARITEWTSKKWGETTYRYEEDCDTLSYGTYANWGVLFAREDKNY